VKGAYLALAMVFFSVAAVALYLETLPPTLRPVTFTKDVAPIVYKNCAACHREGESAPFALLSYEDVQAHAEQIADITKDRIMPPWLPTGGHEKFAGSRRLSDEEIDVFRRWVDGGEKMGNPADLPPPPRWTSGWQLGEPDLIIQMPEVYTLDAVAPGTDGPDVFRNFVIPIPGNKTRYVRAIELRPGNKKIVHHASMFIDQTRSARRLDEADPGPGFSGMDVGEATYPDGHFLGWTPGKMPDYGVEGISWRLEPGSDLVLQLHMLPSGKSEDIQASVGLFFDESPRSSTRAYTILLKADHLLKIPPGEENFTVGDSFKMPLDAQAMLIYPHAHYLGKQIEAIATLPDGSLQSLIKIDDWDFNWQDSYRYTKPIEIPQGTTIAMRWSFDNSSKNVRNPHNPPVEVGYGNRSSDEMAHLYLQLILQSEEEVNLMNLAVRQQFVEKFPGDWKGHTQLGRALEAIQKTDEAIESYQTALRLKEDYPRAHKCLALIRQSQGMHEEAVDHFTRAIEANPDDAAMISSLAHVLEQQGHLKEAIERYRESLKIAPNMPGVLNNLAWILATCSDETLRDPAAAVDLAQKANDLLEHKDAAALDTLAATFAASGDYAQARQVARKAFDQAKKSNNKTLALGIRDRFEAYSQDRLPWASTSEPKDGAPDDPT